MWTATTVLWFDFVVRCGQSGHLWHCKYVKNVAVWSFYRLLFSPSLVHSRFSSPRYKSWENIVLRPFFFPLHTSFLMLTYERVGSFKMFHRKARPSGTGSTCQQVRSCTVWALWCCSALYEMKFANSVLESSVGTCYKLSIFNSSSQITFDCTRVWCRNFSLNKE